MDPLIALIAKALKAPADSLNDDSSPKTVPRWDSLGAMNLVVALEDAYNVEFSTPEIMGLKSIGAIRSALRAKGCDV